MAKEDLIKINGVVAEILPNTKFIVELQNGHRLTAHLGGRLRENNIRIMLGDQVEIEMTPYDLTQGRIVYRGKR